MSKSSIIIDLFNYFTKPSKYQDSYQNVSFLKKFWLFIRVYSLNIFFTIIAGIVLSTITFLFGINVNDSEHAVAEVLQNAPLAITIYLGVISAPLFEEIAFRLSIKTDNKKVLAIGLGGFIWFMFQFFMTITIELFDSDHFIKETIPNLYDNFSLILEKIPFINDQFAFILSHFLIDIGIILFLAVVIFVLLKLISQEKITNFTQKRASWILYGSSLLFAFIHIANYETRFWHLFLLLTLPQLVVGLFMAFVRAKLGFSWAMLVHAVHNGVILIPFATILHFYPDFLDKLQKLEGSSNISSLSNGEITALSFIFLYAIIIITSVFMINIYNLIEFILYKSSTKVEKTIELESIENLEHFDNFSIQIKNLTKKYGDFIALDDFSTNIAPNQIIGLLGPNGAGKSTFLRMLTQIYTPTSGKILIQDEKLSSKHRDLFGYLPEDKGLYQDISLIDQLIYIAQLKGMKADIAKKESYFWLEKFNLQNYAKKRIQSLSKGMQQKIQFITAVIHSPKIVILDEPLSGLDPLHPQSFNHYLINTTNT